MRARLSSDTLLLGAVLILTLGIAIFAVRSGRSQQEDEDRLSTRRTTYSPSVGGYQALYETMERLGYPVQRWRSSLEGLRERGTLIVASPEPGAPITAQEWQGVSGWVSRGNLLILLADQGELLGAETRLTDLIESVERTSRPVQPTPPAAAAPALRTRAAFHLDPDDEAPAPTRPLPALLTPSHRLPLYRDESGTTVAAVRWGAGAVILCSSPWSLSTAGVGQGDNFAWLLATIGAYEPKSGVGRWALGVGASNPNTPTPNPQPLTPNPIFFDEYHHGYGVGRGILSLLAPIARLGLAQLAVAGLLLLYTVSRRFGRRLPDEERVRRSRSEYLGSMASLLRRARAVDLAVAQVRRQFMSDAQRALGLPRDAPEELLLAAAAARGVEPERLRALIDQAGRLAGERDPGIRAAGRRQEEAVTVARELVRMRRRLTGEAPLGSDGASPPAALSIPNTQNSND